MSALLTMRGHGLTAVVAPARGGKIVSLMDDSGREWLAQADPDSRPGAAFTEAEMAGWDECSPSIVACSVDGRDIPDHGDLWDREFEVDGATVRGRGDGYTLERTIEPTAHGLRLSYRATADRPMPFLWAAHPQFSAPAGTEVRLPESVLVVIDVMRSEPTLLEWNRQLARVDTLASGACRKVYLEPNHAVDTAYLVRPDDATLRLQWSPNVRYLGLWFDNTAFSQTPVIAIEPSTGFYDSLERAIAAKRVARLTPGEALEWWLELSLLESR